LNRVFFQSPDGRFDRQAFSAVDCVVDCAGLSGVFGKRHSMDLYREINVKRAVLMAQAAASAGVSRFIYLSSVKALGETTESGRLFTSEDVECPQSYYGKSKFECEQELRRISQKSGLEVVIIRPPLVYGPNVKGNFYNMIKLIDFGIPVPVFSPDHRRSLVSIDNLCDLIMTCAAHPNAAQKTFMVSDGMDLSTRELFHSMSTALGKPYRCFPVSGLLCKRLVKLIGGGNIMQRLAGSLQVDITHTRATLDWEPRISVDEGMLRTAAWYLSRK